MKTQDLLFELGCEELPSGSVLMLGKALAEGVQVELQALGIAFQSSRFFATPRRLAVLLTGVALTQPDQSVQRRGPAVASAVDSQGQPTPALLGFAKSCGVAVADLSIQTTEKGSWYAWEGVQPGKATEALLPAVFQKVLSALPIAKPMYWGDKIGPFVRPVHWVVFLFGDTVIPATVYGIEAGRETFGHRYHYPEAVTIESPAMYEEILQTRQVIADFEKREQTIQQLAVAAAAPHQASPVMPAALLNEVASIVEWPFALIGRFEERFLALPPEVLITSLQTHQKCFALQDPQGHLVPYFVMVANLESPSPKQVIAGNEKVVRARLTDAAFFCLQDQKNPLESFFPLLEQTRLHEKLGSVADQVRRIESVLLSWISAVAGDAVSAKRAALLSKCDLMTGMVGEFPELQGLIGAYYAANQGEAAEVVCALREQYLPKSAYDTLPSASLSMLLALSNRLDALIGAFGVGLKPTGMKDPYKCRRHALAAARLLMQRAWPMRLSDALQAVLAAYGQQPWVNSTLIAEVKAFILERLPAYFESHGIGADMVASVCAVQSEDLYDLNLRLQALKASYEQLTPLIGGVKRVGHLLKSASDFDHDRAVDVTRLEAGAEQQLWQAIEQTTQAHAAGMDYETKLKTLAALRPCIDQFFEAVMVMVDDEGLRNNRFALLKQLHQLLSGVADLSYLQPIVA